MAPEERARRAEGLKEIVTSRDPGDWIDEQIEDISKKARPARTRLTASTRILSLAPKLNSPLTAARARTRAARVGIRRRRRALRRGRGRRHRGSGAARGAPAARGARRREAAAPHPHHPHPPAVRAAPPAHPLPPRRPDRAAAAGAAPAADPRPHPPRPRRRRRRRARGAGTTGTASRPGTRGASGASAGHATTRPTTRDQAQRPADVPPAHALPQATVHAPIAPRAPGRLRPRVASILRRNGDRSTPLRPDAPPRHRDGGRAPRPDPRERRARRSRAAARSSAATSGACARPPTRCASTRSADYHLIQFRGRASCSSSWTTT